MRLVVSFYFEIDTKSTQTPKNRHKMQKIDTKNLTLYARIVRATVNNERKLRVYINQERVGDFDTIQQAIKFMISKQEIEMLRDILNRFDESAKQPTESRLEKLTKSAIDGFDFEKVHEHMVHTNWTWFHGLVKGPSVPTVDEMIENAKYLIKSAYDGLLESGPSETNYVSSTGGFKAEAYKDAGVNEVEGVLLSFVIEYSNGHV